MASTALVWFRRDLRVHDHPALTAAARGHERVAAVFVLDERLLDGRFPSPARRWFLLESLRELREALRASGGELIVRTGFPVVDAAMRQLRARGWMHNRGRLIVGSFLTKDLHIDWRRGEAHFMRWLLCGDEAQNIGNWQWIASVGVDPAPYFRRMYNPMTQQRRHDPDGEYVRRWVPELRDVPLKRLAEPWTMSEEEQAAAGCAIGRDYPQPIVDHKRERERAMERYRAVRTER